MMKAINLRTESMVNPMGLDVPNPSLSWICEGGQKQTAYRIVATDADGRTLYDSTKVHSDKMTFIKYPLNTVSRQRVYWKVKLWDENDTEGEWSDEVYFEIGLRKPSDWRAKWITGNYTVDRNKLYPVDCFKKEFKVTGEVKSARLYSTACGVYSCCINGESVSMPMAPGITDYRKRVQYQTADVTNLIKGENRITVELADGWYRGQCGAWSIRNQYGTETKCLIQLEIVCLDGTVIRVKSDETWDWSNDGRYSLVANKDGETVDANKEPSYSSKAKVTSHTVIPSSSNNVPIKEKETFKPELIITPKEKKVLDFKQNISGWISFKLNAHKGDKITIRCGELIDKDGELTLSNIQVSNKRITTPLQKIEYTCKEGLNEFKNRFSTFGFRYAEVDTVVPFSPDDFTAIAVYSDIEETGFFSSSNELLNGFVDATKWSTKSNSTDLPTDCPTRERHGWTGDAQIFSKTANYLFDYEPFTRKYLRDVYDWQKPNGKLPHIAPEGGSDFYMYTMNGSVGWADAGVIIPYTLWKMYDDKDILVQYYDRMKRYAEFMQSRCGKVYPTARPVKVKPQNYRYLSNFGQAYGEWAEPKDVFPQDWKTCVITHPETATAYTSYIMSLMSEIASELGKDDDSKQFKEFSEGSKRAYNDLVELNDHYTLDTDRQARLVRPLAFDMLNDKNKGYARTRLIKALDNYSWRVGTGFLSTPLILHVLADIDVSYAYKLLENEEIPGWLSMVKNGATTVWEDWEGPNAQNGIGSLNHYSKGAVCEWLFSSMCGINVSGENHFVIKPAPGGSFTYANAEYRSIYGTVKSGWRKQGDGYIYEIEIPSNCTAEIILPGGETQTVPAGLFQLTINN